MDLREIRKSKFLTRKFVASKLGIQPNTLSKKESGLRAWTIQEIEKQCELYDIEDPTVLADWQRLKG